MHHRQDADLAWAERVEKTIGESAEKLATDGSSDNRLEEIVANQPPDREIHVIAGNLSAHKTSRVKQFLEDHPQVQQTIDEHPS